MKRACIVFLLALALFLGLSAAAMADDSSSELIDIIASGTCGENLTWTIDSYGLLSINGNGAMMDYSGTYYNDDWVGDTPWKAHHASISSVYISDRVTRIGNYAFCGCISVTSVTMPNSITSIGKEAFRDCSFTSVDIPDCVTSIQDWAFAYCRNLTSINIPNSVTSIQACTFESCSNLTSVTIGSRVTSIGNSAFARCDSLTSICMPSSVTTIDVGAFMGCGSLTSITIPNSVTNIGYHAFLNCTNLSNVSIPNSVTSIGYSAFEGCSSLSSITISNNITIINEKVFKGCCSLTNLTIPNGITCIGTSAFEGCSNLSSITIPNSVNSICDSAFLGCSNLKNIIIGSNVTSIGDYAFSSCNRLVSMIIPDSVTSIGCRAFYNCNNLISIIIEGRITSIREEAFRGCSSLTSLTIPNSIIAIGNYAFSECYSLNQVNYHGTEEEWNRITIGTNNQPLSNAIITFASVLTITSQPSDFTGKAGSTVRFTVGASGDGLTYQWYFKRPGETSFNRSTVAAATKKTFTMTMQDKYDGYQYYCLVKDSHGGSVRSDTVTIHKAAVLAVATQPADYYGPVGSTIKFTVSATGDGLTYQWYYKKAGESTFNKSTLSSAIKKTFSMTMADRHDGWQYYCIVTDAYGDTVKSDTVTVHKVAPLSITSQPVAYSGTAGSLVKFSVTASGEGLTYQWYFKKTGASSFAKSTLASGTKAEYSMTLQDKHDGWQYYCLVKDVYGNSVKTDTVSINVITPLDITSLPQNFTGPVGSTAELDIEAEGEGLTYQWYYKTSALSAFTKSTTASGKSAHYRLKLAARHDGWKFYCVVSDAYGNKLRSNTVIVHVSAANELCIIKQPADFNGAIGQTANFTVKAAGEGLTYQWYYKTPTATKFSKCTSASGTTPTYSITVNTKHPGYKYYCIVKDAAGNSLRTNTVTIYITE